MGMIRWPTREHFMFHTSRVFCVPSVDMVDPQNWQRYIAYHNYKIRIKMSKGLRFRKDPRPERYLARSNACDMFTIGWVIYPYECEILKKKRSNWFLCWQQTKKGSSYPCSNYQEEGTPYSAPEINVQKAEVTYVMIIFSLTYLCCPHYHDWPLSIIFVLPCFHMFEAKAA